MRLAGCWMANSILSPLTPQILLDNIRKVLSSIRVPSARILDNQFQMGNDGLPLSAPYKGVVLFALLVSTLGSPNIAFPRSLIPSKLSSRAQISSRRATAIEPPLFENSEYDETAWAKRRQELLELFKTHVYGRVPDTAYDISFKDTISTS